MGVINGFKQFFSSIYALKDVIVGRKITTVGKDLQLLPDAGQITKVGSGTPSHAVGNSDFFVSGILEAAGYIRTSLGVVLASGTALYTGSAGSGFLYPSSKYHNLGAFNLCVGDASKHIVITTFGARLSNYLHPLQTDPTEFLHSATLSTSSIIEYIGRRHNKTDAEYEIGKGGVVTNHVTPVELADDASFDLPDASAGWGTLMVGDNEEYTTFRWSSDGTVVLEDDATANVVATDTDANLCIFDNGTAVRVRNRLGSAKKIMFTYNYTTP